MTTLTEKSRALEFLISENNGDFAREQVTLITGQNLEAGTVLGKITASGKYTILAPAAVTGEEVAAAILCQKTDATAADKRTAIILGSAEGVAVEVNGKVLVYPGGITGPQTTTAIANLLARGIKVR